VLEAVRPVFRAAASSMVPDLQHADAAEWTEVEALVERTLAQRPPALRRQLVTFLRLLDWWPFPRYGRRLTKLPPPQRDALLARLERHAVPRLRRGMWGLRTLVFLGYYARPRIGAFIGYRAHRDGWDVRPDARRERPSVTPRDLDLVRRTPSA
jgi:hypothetical protein